MHFTWILTNGASYLHIHRSLAIQYMYSIVSHIKRIIWLCSIVEHTKFYFHATTKQNKTRNRFSFEYRFISFMLRAQYIPNVDTQTHTAHTHTLYLVREERKKTERNKENSKKIANSLQTFRSLANMWSTLINVGEIKLKLKPKLAPWNTSLKVIRRA